MWRWISPLWQIPIPTSMLWFADRCPSFWSHLLDSYVMYLIESFQKNKTSSEFTVGWNGLLFWHIKFCSVLTDVYWSCMFVKWRLMTDYINHTNKLNSNEMGWKKEKTIEIRKVITLKKTIFQVEVFIVIVCYQYFIRFLYLSTYYDEKRKVERDSHAYSNVSYTRREFARRF